MPTKSVLNPSTQAFSTPTMLVDSKQTALLQKAFNPWTPSKQTELRFLFDSRSQKSYITEGACKELALKARGERAMSIMTFGSTVHKN